MGTCDFVFNCFWKHFYTSFEEQKWKRFIYSSCLANANLKTKTKTKNVKNDFCDGNEKNVKAVFSFLFSFLWLHNLIFVFRNVTKCNSYFSYTWNNISKKEKTNTTSKMISASFSRYSHFYFHTKYKIIFKKNENNTKQAFSGFLYFL